MFLKNLLSESNSTLPDNQTASDDLTRINKELYERNVELAVRNRTLSVLRKLYDIINTSLGVQPTSQKLIDEVIHELKLQSGFIALINQETKVLQTIAVSSFTEGIENAIDSDNNIFRSFAIPLTETDNFCVDAALHNRRRLANVLVDVLSPAVEDTIAFELQGKLNIQTSLIYPISFAGNVLGIMMVGLNKHIGALSRAERETLHELIEVVSIAIERAQIFEDLQHANEQLKELDKIKDEFVYMASHELRTPMTAIKNYLWLALNKHQNQLDDTLKTDLTRAYISTERLIRLVQDMLMVSRIEGKRMVFDLQELHMGDVIKQIVDELSVTAKEKNLSLLYVPTTDCYKIKADQTRIMEVLQNLIGNALKFTPAGGTITVSIKRNNGMVETNISDTGVGIPGEDIARLFQKFGRLGHSYKRLNGETGTGLGLFISKQIVEAHGGKIWVDSIVDQGSTFSFSIPEVVSPSTDGQAQNTAEIIPASRSTAIV